MKRFHLINNIMGWLAFAVAALVYLLTIEPTTSFWDCGEFLATSYKLEVGHPPGAPVFMILARFFSLFASGPEKVALMVNAMSALASAFTIMFLFWTITHLARKIMVKEDEEISRPKLIAMMGAGLVGALACTFSDTFWFSAVEAEVYASSSLFTAVVFWAILKWENVAFERYANRWLMLIAYLMGLSIGVHLLNLLAIPAIVMVYYFKKYEPTRNGILKAAGVALLLLGGIMYGIIPGVIKVASWFEMLFVNGFGLPFNTGVIFYALLLIGLIVWGIRYTIQKELVLANTLVTAFTVILIGYSSFAMVVIRSAANPPLDENNPNNVFSLLSYLNREQYGDRPLFYGQYFNAPFDEEDPYSEGKPVYIQKNGRYEAVFVSQKPNFDSRYTTLFPRMFSADSKHVREYAKWTGVDPKAKSKPSFAQNLKFFFSYQVNHMYFRYFMWNFAGRQNDVQSNGEVDKGNWITGIPFLDSWRLGDQQHLPKTKSNAANNKYYLLPLLLGLLGMVVHYRSGSTGKRDFWVVMLLFVFTGIAIVVYLNQTPLQPRERDYAYAGSFYAFAIWIGLGVLGIWKLLEKIAPSQFGAVLAGGLCLVTVPGLMAQQNWDDHDRSDRYTAHDLAYDYLNSCAPNAILFTMGDNDTFPLWYLQEVEGVRTDVRVCNLSYLATDWYIDQMVRKAYDSAPIPFSLTHDQYVQGKRDAVYLVEDPRLEKWVEETRGLDIRDAIEYVASDKPSTKKIYGYDEPVDHFPASKFRLPIDRKEVLESKTLTERDTAKIVDQIEWELKQRRIFKNDLMVLDLIAQNNWKRPIYFAITVPQEAYLNLKDYFQLEGFAYRFVPIKTVNEDGQIGRVETGIMYDNLMNNFKWGNMNDPKVYLDENNIRMTMNIQNNFLRLSEALLEEGKRDSAVQVLDRCLELIPNEKVPYNYFTLLMAQNYYRAGETEKANAIVRTMSGNLIEELDYFFAQRPDISIQYNRDKGRNLALLQELLRYAVKYEQEEFLKIIEPDFRRLVKIYQGA